MVLKFLKPITSSQRHLVILNKKHLSKKPLVKTEISGLKNSSGRNNSGKITVRHKGSGHKRKYRKINFLRNYESTGIVTSIEYDPNRNTNIASIYDFTKNHFFYMLAPKNLEIGNIVQSGVDAEPMTGNSLPIYKIPEESFIHNVSPKISKKAQISRSAGTFSLLKEKTRESACIELSSGEQRLLSSKCYATIGIVSNEAFSLTRRSKAGHSRWLNKRPTVRGVAMNPVDHPNGGGEGKKSGKAFSLWGKPNKSGKTSRTKNKLIIKKV
uniref:ribosomal protein L2 n=1 Tax=Haslea pseudostrearia TaxID=197756 RepID=UPI002207331B|nr:ribosomal protein L2 [Haslea pseudostrearia]UXN44198.1 ribosomal protein L2 [Haslea pseudostrearia]